MEAGCQLELAGAPHEDLHQVASEMQSHLNEVSPCRSVRPIEQPVEQPPDAPTPAQMQLRSNSTSTGAGEYLLLAQSDYAKFKARQI